MMHIDAQPGFVIGCEMQDITGQQFGRLAVLRREPSADTRNSRWLCRCECGNYIVAFRCNLVRRPNGSCGCGNPPQLRAYKHGKSQSAENAAWRAAKKRCYNPKDSKFKDYGARGIHMCDEWLHDFAAFYEHVGPRPSSKYSLDRKDVNGNYEPGNVRWATAEEQANNQRKTLKAVVNGELLTASQIAIRYGFKHKTIASRIRHKLPLLMSAKRGPK